MTQAYHPLGFFPENADAETIELPIAISQTITKGDAVIWDTGLVAIALANSSRILGVAAESATSSDASVRTDTYSSGKNIKNIKVWGVVNPNEVFLGCQDADASSIVANTLQDIIGATGAMYLDTSASSIDAVTTLSMVEGEAIATVKSRWRFVINKSDVDPID